MQSIFLLLLDDAKLVVKAFKAILEDESFKLPSPQASAALKAASFMLEWVSCGCDANKQCFDIFSSKLVKYLRICLPANPQQSDREEMWCRFHTLRTSKDFFILWNDFLKKSIQDGISPIFFQYITNHIFKEMIKHHFPAVEQPIVHTESLSYEERVAIRYAAGFIPRAIKKNWIALV